MNDSGTFNAAAFAAGLVLNPYDPGLPPPLPRGLRRRCQARRLPGSSWLTPQATLSRSYAAL